MATLYLMLGYPGAGKTTTAALIHALTGAVHVSSDTARLQMFSSPDFSQDEHDSLYKALDEQTENLLTAGKDVIYDANLNRHRHRQEKYAICERTGATPVLLWVKTAKELARQRATDTSRSHLVPHGETLDEMFNRIADIIEEPDATEPFITIDGTNVSAEYIRKTLSI